MIRLLQLGGAPAPFFASALVALTAFFAPQGPTPSKPTASKPTAAPDLKELAREIGDVRRSLDALPAGEGKLPTILVNAARVSPDEVKRLALYMSGAASILAFQLDLATQEELERQKKEGVDISKLMVPDKDVQERVELFRRNLEQMQPDITWDQMLASRQQTEASYEWVTRVQLQFEAVFLPLDTEKWPPATLEAAKSLAGTDPQKQIEVIEQFKKALANRTPNPLLAIFTSQLIKKVADSIVLTDAADGLPADTALGYRGHAVKNADLIAKGMGFGGFPEMLRATVFAVIREAVKQDIVARETSDFEAARKDVAERRAKGETVEDAKRPVYWLESGSEELKKVYDEERAKYATPPFDHRAIVSLRQFPTMQIYRAYFQLSESYRRASAKTRTEKELLAHVEADKLFFSNGTVDAQVIWYSYMADASKGSYEEGFAAAKARAQRGYDDIKKGAELADKARVEAKAAGKTPVEQEKAAIEAARGYTYDEILDRDSDYRDPRAQPGQPPPPVMTNRGRLGSQQRNPFCKSLHESELSSLIQGYSLGEDVFFHAPVGKVVGPARGSLGYYIFRVMSRTPGAKQMDLSIPSQHSLAEEDYLNHAFQDYVNEVLKKAKVQIVEG